MTQRLSGMGIQEVGMGAGKEVGFNEERSSVGMEEEKNKSGAKEEEGAKVDNTGLGAEATRGVVEGANVGGKQ